MKVPAKFRLQSLPGNEEESTLSDVWASALELSCMWQMDKVREMSVKEISQLQDRLNTKDQTDLLRLSTKLGVPKFVSDLSSFSPTLFSLSNRSSLVSNCRYIHGCLRVARSWVRARGGISLEHEKVLGRKTTSKLFRIRDEYLRKYEIGVSPNPWPVLSPGVASRRVFTEELKDAGWDGK